MFICEVCGHTAPPNTTCNRVITNQKMVYHPSRARANRAKTEDGRWEDVPDLGGKGLQIAREIKVCINCKDNFQPEAKVLIMPPPPTPKRRERDDDDYDRGDRDRDRNRERNFRSR